MEKIQKNLVRINHIMKVILAMMEVSLCYLKLHTT